MRTAMTWAAEGAPSERLASDLTQRGNTSKPTSKAFAYLNPPIGIQMHGDFTSWILASWGCLCLMALATSSHGLTAASIQV